MADNYLGRNDYDMIKASICKERQENELQLLRNFVSNEMYFPRCGRQAKESALGGGYQSCVDKMNS